MKDNYKMKLQTTSIVLQGLRFYARHGVDPQETAVGAQFTIDLKIETDFSRALETDELEGTVSYASIYEVVKEEMQTPSALLEHVGGRIVKRIFRDFPTAQSIRLKLLKQNPPMGADCDGAGIEIVCEREEKES